MRAIPILILTLLAAAAPALAQQPGADAKRPGHEMRRPSPERLQELRLQRMREALQLDEQQAAALAQSMEQMHRAFRESRENERAQIERLRSALRAEPVDQATIKDALAAIERERETMARAHREQGERLKQQLTPEQQAKLLLFNHQFEHRVRELMSERRDGPRMRGGSGMRPRGPGMGPGPRGDADPGSRP